MRGYLLWLMWKYDIACKQDGETSLLPEMIELPEHPWYVGVQFHPELKSKPFDPHPLFSSFVNAAVERSRLV